MTLSQIISHYSGRLQTTPALPDTSHAWESIMVLANELQSTQKELAEVKAKLARFGIGKPPGVVEFE